MSSFWSRLKQVVAPEPPPAPVVQVVEREVERVPGEKVLYHKGQRWVLDGDADARGLMNFTREDAVRGRVAVSSLRVHRDDLILEGDTYILQGRN